MIWDNLDKVEEFVRRSRMSSRPEFYSGRDAMLCDLNKKHLESIYQDIITEFGAEAGNSFLQMVNDIKVLSATRFLNTLYSLCRNNWVWNKEDEGSNIAVDSVLTGWGTIGSTLSGGVWDQTNDIKREFLKNHGIEIEETMYRDSYGYCYYR